MIQLILLATMLGPEPQDRRQPPLSDEQAAQIRTLIQETKARDSRIKTQLARCQRELTDAYRGFEIDEKNILQLQQEIVDLQKSLLDNYHRLQTGLRRIAGRERFKVIKTRVDLHLRSKDTPKKPAPGAKEKSGTEQS